MKSKSVRVLMSHSFFSAFQDLLPFENIFHLLLDKIQVFEIILFVYLCIFSLFLDLPATCKIFFYFCYLCISLFDNQIWHFICNFFNFVFVLRGEGGQRVLVSHFSRIVKTSHMHRISCKTSHIDAMIVEKVSIEAIVMPNFQMFIAFEVRLKEIY